MENNPTGIPCTFIIPPTRIDCPYLVGRQTFSDILLRQAAFALGVAGIVSAKLKRENI
jgi:hypothetical protein